ncbi:54S ribosomal protein L3 mitochondrial, variant 2 [Entomophthora muscae]|uniref:54S ribosomal protein L3 mitochondrial, variant 2 n=1 Tax=Entomophthora muscae TaxID=34485 RepID=A0ACC2S6P9_9FUNG|nr:54S ribosomal protein L3 mitochondrial, variant 2 [Entomophthora muscae]
MASLISICSKRIAAISSRARISSQIGKTNFEQIQSFKFNTQCSVVSDMAPGPVPEAFENGPDRLQVDLTTPALSALLARLNIKFSDPSIMRQVLTHKSYLAARAATNERLRYLGKKVIALYVVEYYHIKYPHLPTTTIENVLRTHYDSYSLAHIGKAFGMGPLIKFKINQDEEDKTKGISKILGKSVQALVGAVYHDKGAKEAKEFIHKYLTSRDIDPTNLLPLEEPKKTLSSLLRILDKEPLVSRLLKETGRLSNRPVFIVGAFSGTVKLGEGYGSSLKMAEFRACRDAIVRYYMKELKDFKLPSDMEGVDDDSITFFPTKLHNPPTCI